MRSFPWRSACLEWDCWQQRQWPVWRTLLKSRLVEAELAVARVAAVGVAVVRDAGAAGAEADAEDAADNLSQPHCF